MSFAPSLQCWTPNNNLKSGFLVTGDMKIRHVTSRKKDFDYQTILSIVRIIQWLNDNVLTPYPEKGYYLREKIAKGVELTEKTNSYLINSYRYWKGQIGQGRIRQKTEIDVSITHCLDPTCIKCQKLQQIS